MFCSTIIPTIGRPSLDRAVSSILDQEFSPDHFEVIVVNDSGRPLPYMEWQNSPRVQVIETNQHERSVARNTGAAIARGIYLHFLDDDDWVAPNALQNLWKLSQGSRAAWLYGSSQLVDREQKPIIQLHHQVNGNCLVQVMAGEWIPLQASLIAAKTFFELGGFNPHIAGPEDIDLLRRTALRGDISGISSIVAYIVRGIQGTTTDYVSHPEKSRWAREQILDESGVFSRLLASANSDYWRGRMLRIYLTSAIWNVQHKRLAIAASRLAAGLAVMVLSHFRIFSGNFWNAFLHPYQSPTFARGFSVLSSKSIK